MLHMIKPKALLGSLPAYVVPYISVYISNFIDIYNICIYNFSAEKKHKKKL